jgi:hypothetical protein
MHTKAHAETVKKDFFALAKMGRNAAIDINLSSGEIALVTTRGTNFGDLKTAGLGAIPRTYTDNWMRLLVCVRGEIKEAE